MRTLSFAAAFITMSCAQAGASDGTGPETMSTLADGGVLDTSRKALVQLVESKTYQSWKAEPAPHPSTGPHGTVRTFVNETLYQSLKAGNARHPQGSIAVKELFKGTALSGWAVDVKRDDSTWVFFEGFLPALNEYYFSGPGNLCANCHESGVDFVLVPKETLP
jgi:hypothetical protein